MGLIIWNPKYFWVFKYIFYFIDKMRKTLQTFFSKKGNAYVIECHLHKEIIN